MTSKGLFFKYMRENTKQRLWSVALTALLCFFLFPVLTALETSILLRPDNLSKDTSIVNLRMDMIDCHCIIKTLRQILSLYHSCFLLSHFHSSG